MRQGQHGKRTNGRKSRNRGQKMLKRVVAGFFSALIIVIITLSAGYLWNQHFSKNAGGIRVDFRSDTLSITWKTPFRMDACRVFLYDEGTREYVSCGQYQNEILIALGEDEKEVKLRLQPVRYVEILGNRLEFPLFCKDLTVHPMMALELHSSMNTENKKVSINWQEEEGSTYEVYLFDEHGRSRLYSQTDRNSVTFDLTDDFMLLEHHGTVRVAVRAIRREEEYLSCGPMSGSVVISYNELLDNKLSLCLEQVEERQYMLSWQECYGEWYEVQQWSEEEKRWISKCTLDRTGEMTYLTEHLPSNTQVRLRVISYDNAGERNREEFRTEPSEITFHTGMSPLYCTIWPIVPLKIMDKPQGGEVRGEVPAGQALCVLEENGRCFKIAYQNDVGYIDSRFCMINLPEYLGDLCEYDITNSISSIFRVHEYDIPEITGSVVKGYENVCLGKGDYLVPYLYPCAAKLYQAAVNAAADGYGLRIYDAFRPNEATRYLYDTMEGLLYEPIVEEYDEPMQMFQWEEEAGIVQEDVAQYAERAADGEQAPDGERAAGGEQAPDEEQTIHTEQEKEGSGGEMYDTYWSIMTNDGRYRLGSFLAQNVSAHNRGIALDLVLIDADTKENLPMQTEIHDLSWYSVTGQNNENARLLAQYMKGVGYNDLVTEWWHFQDDDTRNQIGLNSYLTEGVSIEGWKRDDTGWRYRLGDGRYYQDTTVTIDGQECVFDEEGYCIREGLDE